jgi:hypothetical protein
VSSEQIDNNTTLLPLMLLAAADLLGAAVSSQRARLIRYYTE